MTESEKGSVEMAEQAQEQEWRKAWWGGAAAAQDPSGHVWLTLTEEVVDGLLRAQAEARELRRKYGNLVEHMAEILRIVRKSEGDQLSHAEIVAGVRELREELARVKAIGEKVGRADWTKGQWKQLATLGAVTIADLQARLQAAEIDRREMDAFKLAIERLRKLEGGEEVVIQSFTESAMKALMEKLQAAEAERDNFKAAANEWHETWGETVDATRPLMADLTTVTTLLQQAREGVVAYRELGAVYRSLPITGKGPSEALFKRLEKADLTVAAIDSALAPTAEQT